MPTDAHRMDWVELHRHVDVGLAEVGGPPCLVVEFEPLAHNRLTAADLIPRDLRCAEVWTAICIPLLDSQVKVLTLRSRLKQI